MKVRRILISILIALPSFVIAEEPRAGRLPDGRAYRIDQSGYQLVDHIAELEVTIAEQNAAIDELERRAKSNSNLPAAASSCSEQEGKIRSLETQIAQLRSATSSAPSELGPARGVIGEYQQRDQDLQESLRSSQQLINRRNSELEAAQLEIQNLRQEVSSLQSSVTSSESAENDLQEKLKAELDKSHRDLRERESEIASLKSEVERSQRVATRNPNPAPISSGVVRNSERARVTEEPVREESARTPEFLELRREFQKRLSEIQSLVLKRKDLSDSLRGSKSGVTVPLQALKSSRGQSLDSLRSLISKLSSEREAQTIRLSLSEIQQILSDDIRTMERLKKL